MMESYPIIALEGLSGTGKTTVGKLLAEKTKGYYFHCMEKNPIGFAKKTFDKLPNFISFFYYLLFFNITLRQGRKLAKSSIVFMDKSGAWMYSHFKAQNLPDTFFKLLPKSYSANLDAILYFTLNEQDRNKRIRERMKKGKASSNDIKSLKIYDKIDFFYHEYSPLKIIEVNTNNKTPEEVAKLTIKILTTKKIIKQSEK